MKEGRNHQLFSRNPALLLLNSQSIFQNAAGNEVQVQQQATDSVTWQSYFAFREIIKYLSWKEPKSCKSSSLVLQRSKLPLRDSMAPGKARVGSSPTHTQSWAGLSRAAKSACKRCDDHNYLSPQPEEKLHTGRHLLWPVHSTHRRGTLLYVLCCNEVHANHPDFTEDGERKNTLEWNSPRNRNKQTAAGTQLERIPRELR